MSGSNRIPHFLPPLAVGTAILVLAAALRFYQLDGRPVHFDEGVHAYYTWKFAVEGSFTYDPWRHGPLLYYVTAPLMWLGADAAAGRGLGVWPFIVLVSLKIFYFDHFDGFWSIETNRDILPGVLVLPLRSDLFIYCAWTVLYLWLVYVAYSCLKDHEA